MRAGLVTAPHLFELVDMPDPVPTEHHAVVAIDRCGICGTDVHGFLGPGTYNPAICGHEWAGTVVAAPVGTAHAGLEGARVMMGTAAPCGACTECHAGRHHLCLPAFLGMTGRGPLAAPHGGFAPRIAVEAARLVPIHRPLTLDQAAMVEPTTVALHAVLRTPPGPAEVVVVQGCGPIGLLVAQCARALGAAEVVCVEPLEHRRAVALATGATAALTPDEAKERFRRSGADLVFECAGVPSTVQAAVDLVRRGGMVNLVGLASGSATIDPHAWLVKEVNVVASLGALRSDAVQAIDLIADGAVDVDALHDRTVVLDDLPAAIGQLAADPAAALKVLVDPTTG